MIIAEFLMTTISCMLFLMPVKYTVCENVGKHSRFASISSASGILNCELSS